MKRIFFKQATWYGDGGNGPRVNINPSRWGKDKGLGGPVTTKNTKEDIEEQGWGESGKKKQKSDKKKHKINCPCGKDCKCDGKCKCRKL